MKSLNLIVGLSLIVAACSVSREDQVPSVKQIEETIDKGEFTEAAKLIKIRLLDDSLTRTERWDLNFTLDKMDRIKKDFNQKESSVLEYIKKYYPEITAKEIAKWEESNAIENMVIDGERWYFRSAGRNLFRIDSIAGKHFNNPKAGQDDVLNRFLAQYIPWAVKEAQKSKTGLSCPVKMKIRYTLSVKPGEVPSGEVIRVWLPYPRGDASSHKEIKLLSVSQPEYIISPDSYSHKTIYMERTAKAGEVMKFGYELSYTSYVQYFNLESENIIPYDKESSLYKKFTSEDAPHIIFSDKIRKITSEVIGDETNPYLKVKLIYEWIDSNFPWASAREYSTIDNIPGYVLENRHGDCGQVSLLFITMSRIAGVPAKWQSGWMMHPGDVNLHDWAEVYYEGIGWVPVDQSFGRVKGCKDNDKAYYFFTNGLDPYRLIVNNDICSPLYPAKIYPRSETVDFQRGEVEWRGENLYFDRWDYDMEVEYLK
jgi:transglutaminase-like putative cysteine protease